MQNAIRTCALTRDFGKLRAPFHLYVPAGMVEVARRLADENHIHVNEIWSYHTIGDEIHFTLVHRSRETPAAAARARAAARPAPAPRRKPAARAAKPAARTAKRATRPRKTVKKPARSSKRK